MRTVFILYHYPLFARGLQELLQQENEVKVIGVEARGAKALSHIRALKPDVVIVEAEEEELQPEMLLSCFLQEQMEARMVLLSLKNNIAIFHSIRRWRADTGEDLVKGILRAIGSPSIDKLADTPRDKTLPGRGAQR